MIDNQIILYKFIKINKNINWSSIPYNYKLSENFIREFQNEVTWYYILKYQTLSENFKKEFINKIK